MTVNYHFMLSMFVKILSMIMGNTYMTIYLLYAGNYMNRLTLTRLRIHDKIFIKIGLITFLTDIQNVFSTDMAWTIELPEKSTYAIFLKL